MAVADRGPQAPSLQVKNFQELEINLESGRSHVPSQAGKVSAAIAASSINLRKQLLLVMRQLNDDIESVSTSQHTESLQFV